MPSVAWHSAATVFDGRSPSRRVPALAFRPALRLEGAPGLRRGHMAVIGIVNLADILLNPTATASKEIPAATPGPATVNNGTPAATGDQFTVSGQNTAQAAGLFTVNQFAVFSAAAEAILARTPAQASPATTPAATANVTTPTAIQTAAATAATTTPAPANTAATKAAAAA